MPAGTKPLSSVDSSSKVCFSINLETFHKQEVVMNIWFYNIYPDITLLKSLPHLPGRNDLIQCRIKINPSWWRCLKILDWRGLSKATSNHTFSLTHPPSSAYVHQWIGSAVVQIMACRLFGDKPLSKQCWVIVNWTLWHKLQWICYQNTNLFFHENASDTIVCEMAAILSRRRWVKVSGVGSYLCGPRWHSNTETSEIPKMW